MAVTTTVITVWLVSVRSTLYDVSKDELDAMRRYVPEWSKNSTLIPLKDKDGKFGIYRFFSHECIRHFS